MVKKDNPVSRKQLEAVIKAQTEMKPYHIFQQNLVPFCRLDLDNYSVLQYSSHILPCQSCLSNEAVAGYLALPTQREKFLMGGFPGNIVHQHFTLVRCSFLAYQ